MSLSSRWRGRPVQTVALMTATLALLAMSGCAAWRLGQSAELVAQSTALSQHPSAPTRRLLIVGDSTAVGTGASSPSRSLAGLIAERHPTWLIDNRARDGAKFAELVGQLAGAEAYDIVLIQAGGNDVIRLSDMGKLSATIDQVSAAAGRRAKQVVWMPAGNVGNAPFFFAPVSWWMTSRSRELHRMIQRTAERDGAVYVRLFKERANDPFVLQPSLNARDGLHPSDAGYRVWLDELLAQGRVF